MQDFKKLRVWERTHHLSIELYQQTNSILANDESLVWQCRRSCMSISYNIAEGCGRSTRSDQARFFTIAIASSSELECQLLLLRDLKYLNEKIADKFMIEVISIRKMLCKLVAFKKGRK